MGMPRDLVMVRHGRSEANEVQAQVKKVPGFEIPPGFHDRHDSEMVLAPLGVEQAKAAGDWLRSEFPKGFDHHYTSPLIRTIKTAGLLALGANWKKEDLWRERDWGEYGILNDEERLARFEHSYKLKGQNYWYWCPPGGESLASGVRLRYERIQNTLHRECDGQQVIAVTHGDFINAAKYVIEGLDTFQWLAQEADDAYKLWNCQIIHWSRVNPETGEMGPRIEWRRSISPWDETKSWNNGEWVHIERKRYSDEELIAFADSIPPLLAKGE